MIYFYFYFKKSWYINNYEVDLKPLKIHLNKMCSISQIRILMILIMIKQY